MPVPHAYLIFISMDGCRGCERFSSEWDLLKNGVSGLNLGFKKYNRTRATPEIPAPLAKYMMWFPMIILVPGGVYHNSFIVDPLSINDTPIPGKTEKCVGAVFNAVGYGLDADHQKSIDVKLNPNRPMFDYDSVVKWIREVIGYPIFRDLIEIKLPVKVKQASHEKPLRLLRNGVAAPRTAESSKGAEQIREELEPHPKPREVSTKLGQARRRR